jgi:RecB family exonuclease
VSGKDSSRDRLFVVPTENHVLFLAEQGLHAETRRTLFRRLSASLLHGGEDSPTIATRVEAELASSHAHESPRVGRAADKALDLLVDAHGDPAFALKALTKTRLRAWKSGVARTKELLAARGLVHPRETPTRLAQAIQSAEPSRVLSLLGARHLEARFIYDWSASDGGFFRALDQVLARVGGSAVVVLPELDARFDAAREESPHERVAMACARELDAAPRFHTVTVPSTWALAATSDVVSKVTLVRAADRAAEVGTCASLVRDALARGVATDQIGIALPLRGSLLEAEIVRALGEHDILASHGDPELSDSPTIRRFEKLLRKKLPPRATRGAFIALVGAEVAASEEAQRGGVGAFGVLDTDDTPTALGRAELIALTRAAAAWEALSLSDYAHATKRLGLWDTEIAASAFLLEAKAALPSPRDPATRRVAAVRVGTLSDFVGLPLGLLVVLSANDRGDSGDSLASQDPLVRRLLDERRAAHAVSVAMCLDASQSIVLSFQTRNEDGGELAPAPFVAWLERGGATVREVFASPLGPERASPHDLRLRKLSMATDHGAALSPDAFARAQVETVREQFFLDPTRTATALTGLLAPTAEIEKLLVRETGSERAMSVTAIEHMAACPFVGFAESVLGAREKKEEEGLTSMREEGTLVHEALSQAFTAGRAELSRLPASRDLEKILAAGLQAADATFPEGTPEVIRARVRATVNALLSVAAEDVHHAFHVAEQGFGGDASWPAHRITAGDQTLLVRGQIDRVDVGTDGRTVRVLDYKRRADTIRRAVRTLGTTSLQVPLYACVAAKALGKETGDSGFLPTDPRDLGQAAIPVRNLAEAMTRVLTVEDGLAAVERRALQIVLGVRGGDVRPLPVDPGHCGYCPHDGACRKPRFSIEHEREE